MPTLTTKTLDIAYKDGGPPDGPVVLLLHGWPDDATTWDDVAPALHDAGLRTLAPMLRGFGGTRFRDAQAARTGNSAVLAMDAIELLDGLGVMRFAVAGHDWGSNMAEALAVGWPDRVERMALLSSPPRLGGVKTPPFWHAQLQWYHWFQVTRRGAQAVRDDPKGFAHIMWQNWAPPGWFDSATFDRVARSFETSDWVDVTLHSYRARWDEAEPDPASVWLDEKVRQTKTLPLATLYIQGGADGVNPPAVSESVADKFDGPFERVVLDGVGHFPTREAPRKVGELLLRHFGERVARGCSM